VQKAWAAGFSAVVSVSAPSALAVQAAQQAGITVAGFVRGEGGAVTCNVYSGEVARGSA
jgi:FdhD protein